MARSRSKPKASPKPRRGAAYLRARIAALRARRGDTISAREAVEIIDAILAAGKGMAARGRRLRTEIRRLSEFIHALRSDIVAVRTDEVKKEFIPTATDELDAIMDAVEKIEGVGGALSGDAAAKLTDATTKVYEACGFQDITGQRITKVVKALKEIEHRVDAMVAAFGDEAGARPATAASSPAAKSKDGNGPKPITDEGLLNGPQLKSAAKTQDEIDALFGSG
jgi:chemotaxis protein CheZ